MYDVSARHRHDVAENQKRMKQIQTEKPNDYFLDKEWRKLNEENRQHQWHIDDYNRMVKMGVKF